jgi:hypothetical protein
MVVLVVLAQILIPLGLPQHQQVHLVIMLEAAEVVVILAHPQ